MVTKLVYVLTCSPEKHYIEQALIAVFSARHWNPDAYIVLLVDDKTDALLVGKRSELLDYVSEKIEGDIINQMGEYREWEDWKISIFYIYLILTNS